MLRWFKADLHVHTCLSPCADILMSPRRIVTEVLRHQIDIIAITDHNSMANAAAVTRAAARSGIVVLPGMEVCTREEIHVLGIFDNLAAAQELGSCVYEHLNGVNDPDVFGWQVVANEVDEVERFEEKLLIGATDLSIDEVVDTIHRLNGMAVAAHIDREGFGIIGQLGFIPETLPLDALEISGHTSDEEAVDRYGEYARYSFVRNSDAHAPEQLGVNTTQYFLEAATLEEIMKAVGHRDGRTFQTISGCSLMKRD
jgi:PHP family Zn ribbon phosphoesterase